MHFSGDANWPTSCSSTFTASRLVYGFINSIVKCRFTIGWHTFYDTFWKFHGAAHSVDAYSLIIMLSRGFFLGLVWICQCDSRPKVSMTSPSNKHQMTERRFMQNDLQAERRPRPCTITYKHHALLLYILKNISFDDDQLWYYLFHQCIFVFNQNFCKWNSNQIFVLDERYWMI